MLSGVLGAALVPLAGSAGAAEIQPTWLPDRELDRPHTIDELSRAFDTDEDGRVDPPAAQVLPNLLNPDYFTLRVSACAAPPAAPPGFTSIDWRLARPGEAPLPGVTTTDCESQLTLPDRAGIRASAACVRSRSTTASALTAIPRVSWHMVHPSIDTVRMPVASSPIQWWVG